MWRPRGRSRRCVHLCMHDMHASIHAYRYGVGSHVEATWTLEKTYSNTVIERSARSTRDEEEAEASDTSERYVCVSRVRVHVFMYASDPS